MLGLNKTEVLQAIDDLNKKKYELMYKQGRTQLIQKYGDKTPDYFDNFAAWYTQELLPQLTADLIVANNEKITADIQKLLPR